MNLYIFLESQDLSTCDHHWRRQTDHLFYPVIPFTFIGRIEEFSAGLREVTKAIGFDSYAHIGNKSSVDINDGYDEEAATTVRRLYDDDFATFDYDGESWKRYRKKPQGSSTSEAAEREIIERNIVIGILYANRRRAHQGSVIGQPPDPDAFMAAEFEQLFGKYIAPIDGWIGLGEARLLFEAARTVSDGCIVEIGSYRGRSTTALALGSLTGNHVPIFAVDPHDPFTGPFGGQFGPVDRGYFMRNLLETGMFHLVRPLAASSEMLSKEWPVPVRLLFFDADHKYASVARDIEHWQANLPSGALLILNNATDSRVGTGRLAGELIESQRFEQVGLAGNILALRRRGQ